MRAPIEVTEVMTFNCTEAEASVLAFAAQELLRHKSLTTTAMHYKMQTENALPNGMRLLEAASSK